MHLAACADCRHLFAYPPQKGPRRRYCDDCRPRHDWRIPTPPAPRPCEICGAEMNKRADARTCSPRCRRRLNRAEQVPPAPDHVASTPI